MSQTLKKSETALKVAFCLCFRILRAGEMVAIPSFLLYKVMESSKVAKLPFLPGPQCC